MEERAGNVGFLGNFRMKFRFFFRFFVSSGFRGIEFVKIGGEGSGKG